MRRWAVAVLVWIAGCDTTGVPTCPGVSVGTFQFRGDVVAADGGTCPFASDAALSFTATIAVAEDSTAALCPARAGAQPLVGTRDGDHLAVAGAPTPAATPCSCLVGVTESLEGDLLVVDGRATGFAGELTDVLTRIDPASNDGGSCEPLPSSPDAGPQCGVPCEIRWRVTATR